MPGGSGAGKREKRKDSNEREGTQMKRFSFLAALTLLLAVGANAQVLNQATVAWIKTDNPAADPFLCVFGNTIENVMFMDWFLDLNGKEVRNLRQREEVDIHQYFKREAERLNAKYISIHIMSRRIVETNNGIDLQNFFIVVICERVGNRYYKVASNDY